MDHYTHAHHNIVLRVGGLRIRWLFRHSHDWHLSFKHILPWAMSDCSFTVADGLDADWVISVYGSSDEDFAYLSTLPGERFALLGEPTQSARPPAGIGLFGNAGASEQASWRAPTLILWSPPTSNPKIQKCSAIESGHYAWRTAVLDGLTSRIGGVEGYGGYFNRPLPDQHGWHNRKYLGIRDYCFSIGIEKMSVDDYITEKLNDIIMNEAVAIYSGAPNWMDYFFEESVITAADVETIDWNDWLGEHERRRPAVLAQKELLRTRFNIFRYFLALARQPSLLSEGRPITRDTLLGNRF